MLISYYSGNIKDSICKGSVSLDQFLRANRSPSLSVRAIFDRIRKAEENNDKELKSRLKEQLFAFTPGVFIEPGKSRRYENIIRFTGLMQLDFDNEPFGEDLKQWLFNEYEQCVCAYTSPSGVGVKALFRIPISHTVSEYQEYFLGVEKEMEDQGIDSFDHAPYNAILPLFLSWDDSMLSRSNPLIWLKKCLKLDINLHKNLAITQPATTIPSYGEEFGSMTYFRRITIEIFEKKVADIVCDPGHPTLRDACLVLGSRVGAGYISKHEAELVALASIMNNAYLLRKGKSGTDNYIKTSRWAINIGETRPKYYR